jgi:uncharacterized protein YecE (DUF72 family)
LTVHEANSSIADLTKPGPKHGSLMGQILVGTASWTDQSLIDSGRFYPTTANTAEAYLRYYAEQFPVVEVDTTSHVILPPADTQLWAERTPANFVFDIKAFRLFTAHPTPPEVLPSDVQKDLGDSEKKKLYYRDTPADIKDELWRQFRQSIDPLVRAGKLRAVLFQFPSWFIAGRESFNHLLEIRERLPDYLVAIEFRNPSWFDGRHRYATLKFERDNQMCNVVVDEPSDMPGSIPTVWAAPNPKVAIFRLNGRNQDTWNTPRLTGASERFNYEYTKEELLDFHPHLRELAVVAESVHVIFNVNFEDQGVRGARMMQQLLGT